MSKVQLTPFERAICDWILNLTGEWTTRRPDESTHAHDKALDRLVKGGFVEARLPVTIKVRGQEPPIRVVWRVTGNYNAVLAQQIQLYSVRSDLGSKETVITCGDYTEIRLTAEGELAQQDFRGTVVTDTSYHSDGTVSEGRRPGIDYELFTLVAGGPGGTGGVTPKGMVHLEKADDVKRGRAVTRSRRRRLPKATETEVLMRSARRCCLCFGLQGDDAVKNGQIAHLDDDPSNDDFENLAWLCLEHHAQCHTRGNMTKGLSAEEVKTYRRRLYEVVAAGKLLEQEDAPARIIKLHHTFSTTTGERSTVINAGRDVNYHVSRGAKAPPVSPPADAIGANIEMRSYIEYLLGRYIECRKHGIERGVDRRPFFPGTMNKVIKKQFGARANLVAQERFEELVGFVQRAIDNTIWGRNSRHRNYHSFEEHCAKLRR